MPLLSRCSLSRSTALYLPDHLWVMGFNGESRAQDTPYHRSFWGSLSLGCRERVASSYWFWYPLTLPQPPILAWEKSLSSNPLQLSFDFGEPGGPWEILPGKETGVCYLQELSKAKTKKVGSMCAIISKDCFAWSPFSYFHLSYYTLLVFFTFKMQYSRLFNEIANSEVIS